MISKSEGFYRGGRHLTPLYKKGDRLVVTDDTVPGRYQLPVPTAEQQRRNFMTIIINVRYVERCQAALEFVEALEGVILSLQNTKNVW
jgi:hypothetical protein